MPKRSDKEEFIAKSEKIHNYRYDYSKVEYVNARTKVCIICPEHGEFWQFPYSHLTGRGCPKCGRVLSSSKQSMTIQEAQEKSNLVHNRKDTIIHFEKSSSPVCVNTPDFGERWFSNLNEYLSWKRVKKNTWTDELCKQVAMQCKTKQEFFEKFPGAHSYAYKHKLYKNFDWFVKPPKKNRNEIVASFLVYAYKDNSAKSIYIGLTRDMKKRHKAHIKSIKGKFDSVGSYFYSIGKPVPEPEILVKNLNSNDAAFYEGYYVDLYKNNGWKIINKAPCGLSSSSIGGNAIKWTYSECYKAAQKCTCASDFQNRFPGAYRAASINKWMLDYSWFSYRDMSSRKKEIIQLNMDGEFVKKWKSATDVEIELGYSRHNISACCQGRRKQSNGFKWMYAQYST